MQDLFARLAMLLSDVKAKRTARKRIEERVKACKCLWHHEGVACNEKMRIRGLCGKHHAEFLRRMAGMTKEQRIKAETHAIQNGVILNVNEIRQLRRPSPFSRFANA